MTGMRFLTALVALRAQYTGQSKLPHSMKGHMSRLALQIVMGLLGIIPVATGLLGLLGVDDPFYVAAGVPPVVFLDTNLRFYSGVWLGLGLALYWLIPTIEKQTVLFRVLWGMIFIGGISRLLCRCCC